MGELTARVVSVTGPAGSSGGLMLRTRLDADSPYVLIYHRDTNLYFSFRDRTGGTPAEDFTGVQGPWLKIAKDGGSVYVYGSRDGVTWQQAGRVNDRLGELGVCGQTFFGFWSRSGQAGTLSEALFDNVKFTNTSPQGPDLVPFLQALAPEWRTFSASDPDVAAGCVTAGSHWVLPYLMESRNRGPLGVGIGQPTERPDLFKTTSPRGWKELTGYNKLVLKNASGTVLKTKTGSACLSDSHWLESRDPDQPKYDCPTNQGLSASFGNGFYLGDGCQYLLLDDVPAGSLTVELTTNADGYVVEDLYGTKSPSDNTAVSPTEFERCAPELVCGVHCTAPAPSYCVDLDGSSVPASKTLCEVAKDGYPCDGDPTDDPCDPAVQLYQYVYRRDASGGYQLDTNAYWVCDQSGVWMQGS